MLPVTLRCATFRVCYKKYLYSVANIKLSSIVVKMTTPGVIDIDGGIMEGGGQILRIATSLSTLLCKPIRVYNIRAGRKSPGLRPQHLAGLRLVRDLCGAKLIGGEIGSCEIEFHPGKIQSGKFLADPGTAGSIMLLFQVSLPCLLFAADNIELRLKGGTNAEMAPQIDHTLSVFKPIAERFGVNFDCHLIKRGYFPKGGGEVVITSKPIPNSLNPIEMLEPGEVKEISGRSFVAGVLPIKMAHDMADAAAAALRQPFSKVPCKIERVKEPTHSAVGNGSGIVLTAETSTGCLLGGSALGKRGVESKEVGRSAAMQLVGALTSTGCVDDFTQDQIIIFMALAKGKSRVRCGKITLHTETAIHISEMLSEAKFKIEKHEEQGFNIIECEGIGLIPSKLH